MPDVHCHFKRGQAGLSRPRGFTLIELMVTVAVLAIVAAIGYPSFVSVVNNNRLASSANDLVGDLLYARSEAIRRNSRVTVCASADNATCAGAGGNWQSWIVAIEGVPPAADTVLRTGHAKVPLLVNASPAITGNADRVIFRADGLARQAGGTLLVASISTCVATASPAENIRAVEIASGSRVVTTKVNGGGACAAPLDSGN